MAARFYIALATAVLLLHALFIVWVIFGVFANALAAHPSLAAYRFSCLGNPYRSTSLACPLTLLENWLEGNAGIQPYESGFLLHYLDKLVYPDISATALTVAGVIACGVNLASYGRRAWLAMRH